jgi:hypothetical protein
MTAENGDDDLGGDGKVTVNVGVITETILSDFVTTWESVDDLSIKSGWQVIATVCTLFGLSVIALVVGHVADSRESKLKDMNSKVMPLFTYAQTRMLRHSSAHSKKQKSEMGLLEQALPIAFHSEPFVNRFVEESKRYHRWFGIVFYYSVDFPRVFRLLSLLASLVVMLFAQAVTYNIAEPDDGTCETWSNEQDCLAEKSRLASSANMCFWTNSTTSCQYQETSNDIMRTLYVAIISSLISAPLALFQNWILMHILNGSSNNDQEVEIRSHKDSSSARLASLIRRSFVPDSQERKKFLAEKYFSQSTKEEFKQLFIQLRAYRDSIGLNERCEFDGK